ncbi:hypothetical protein M5K25_026128 [Dendrobium thyrsiflorum]|uniref:Uncharacterized protein n=1 Tax=Dendrobium thyrsiflorum TaxID=117978 RepID=A0ABD0TWI1_DENTH
MADPERDFGMAYNEQGCYVHILHSTFFDVDPEVDHTVQGYIDRILDTLVDAVEEQLGTVEWRLAADPKLSCMADPEVDAEFVFDEQGQTDILGSPFFDIYFGFDETIDDYSTATSSTSGYLSGGQDPTCHLSYSGIAQIASNYSPLAPLKERDMEVSSPSLGFGRHSDEDIHRRFRHVYRRRHHFKIK